MSGLAAIAGYDITGPSAAAAQRSFRAVLEAIAHPGRVVPLGLPLTAPPGVSIAGWALCLTLLDGDTSLWLDPSVSRAGRAQLLRFHCGTPVVEHPGAAQFALIADGERMPELSRFGAGSDERPELSATLIIEVREMAAGSGWRLSGPGVDGEVRLAVRGLTPDFAAQWQRNHALFPCGVDVVFTCGGEIAALPRSTRLKA